MSFVTGVVRVITDTAGPTVVGDVITVDKIRGCFAFDSNVEKIGGRKGAVATGGAPVENTGVIIASPGFRGGICGIFSIFDFFFVFLFLSDFVDFEAEEAGISASVTGDKR